MGKKDGRREKEMEQKEGQRGRMEGERIEEEKGLC